MIGGGNGIESAMLEHISTFLLIPKYCHALVPIREWLIDVGVIVWRNILHPCRGDVITVARQMRNLALAAAKILSLDSFHDRNVTAIVEAYVSLPRAT
jgi:hypothetical protein